MMDEAKRIIYDGKMKGHKACAYNVGFMIDDIKYLVKKLTKLGHRVKIKKLDNQNFKVAYTVYIEFKDTEQNNWWTVEIF